VSKLLGIGALALVLGIPTVGWYSIAGRQDVHCPRITSCCCTDQQGATASDKSDQAAEKKDEVKSAVCPVMGNEIPDVTKAAGKSVYKGKTYYFCCPGCKPEFDKNPEKYIGKDVKKK
jgi:YHS domain-containing protein